MSVLYTTTQIAPLSANAGLQQNIAITSPSSLAFFSAGNSQIPGGDLGPQWATPNNTPTGVSNDPTAVAVTTTSSWPMYFVLAAVIYFFFVRKG
jgi:hypothetical protein